MDTVEKILKEFEPVGLAEIGEAKLLDRFDCKFWFHISELADILKNAVPYYNILEINGQRVTDYKTIYFDTKTDLFYKLHHNGKLNRFKVRKRKYLSTGLDFLEIKHKTSKQRTEKKRIQSKIEDLDFTPGELDFLKINLPSGGMELFPALDDWFRRITLVNKNFSDRCTIDFEIVFKNSKGGIGMDNLAVIEIKRNKNLKFSPIADILKAKKVRYSGLSKYCLGRAVLDPVLKQNSFKPKLKFLKKEILANEYSLN